MEKLNDSILENTQTTVNSEESDSSKNFSESDSDDDSVPDVLDLPQHKLLLPLNNSQIVDDCDDDLTDKKNSNNSPNKIEVLKSENCQNDKEKDELPLSLAPITSHLKNSEPYHSTIKVKINLFNKFAFPIFLILILAHLIVNIDFRGRKLNDKIKNTTEIKRSYGEFLGELKMKYPNQTKKFWINIESSFKYSVLKNKDPSIILIVNKMETEQLSKNITFDILSSLKKYLDSDSNLYQLIIDPQSDTHLSNLIYHSEKSKSKFYIDEKLSSIFKSGEKIAMIKNIELLPADNMLLFYSYGDESTKFPGVLILMTVSIDEKFTSSNDTTKHIQDYLLKLWSKEMHEDQIKPLFTRIANNVIHLNNE